MSSFWRSALCVFLALRAADLLNLAASMWLIPRYVSGEELGAVLPLTSFATMLAMPAFAFALTFLRESSVLAEKRAFGALKSLLRGVFLATAVAIALALAAAAGLVPHFMKAMRVDDAAVPFLMCAAAFMGCLAPVYLDALQALKRFGTYSAVEIGAAAVRLAVMAVVMPVRALAGYFAGNLAQPLCRIAGAVFSMRHELATSAAPYWTRPVARRMGLLFVATLVYLLTPMGADFLEQSTIRVSLSAQDSAGYYFVSRLAFLLGYLTYPLYIVVFPFSARAAAKGESTDRYVLRASAVTLGAAAAMALVYAVAGRVLLGWMPHGETAFAYARLLPMLVGIVALTACQTFYTNVEVAAGRFGFLCWFLPLNLCYAAALYFLRAQSLDGLLRLFFAAAAARFLCAAVAFARSRRNTRAQSR